VDVLRPAFPFFQHIAQAAMVYVNALMVQDE